MLRKMTIATDHASYEITRMCADKDAYCAWTVTPLREPMHRDPRTLETCLALVVAHAKHAAQVIGAVSAAFSPVSHEQA